MFIERVVIKGFRNFKEALIPLNDGINVIIGHNNSGKSNLLHAIAFALNVEGIGRRFDIDDLFRETDIAVLKSHSPQLTISLILKQSNDEPNDSEDVGVLSDCLNSAMPPYEAQINVQYSLSAEHEKEYLEEVAGFEDFNDVWDLLKWRYIRFYEVPRWGKNGTYEKANLSEFFKRCDFQYLDAIRDVSRDMCMGYNPLLREVLNFFIDYDIKVDKTKSQEEKEDLLRGLQQEFKDLSNPVIESLKDRLCSGKEQFLEYAKDTGASFGGVSPDFSGTLSESDLFAALRLVIKYETGIEIPATHNGLGYNNLIFISLLLAKMQASADGNYMNRQAKLFPILAIEEPEAHLHPAMQYQFLNFLRKNRKSHNIKQVFVTTHSPEIVSAVSIDDLVCLHVPEYGCVRAGYPKFLFKENEADKLSKLYVQRFLDATRSDMFFASKLIFVEGIAEELLLPTFAKYLGYDLAAQHVLIVNMGGRYFKHFLKLFDGTKPHSIYRKVACVTDVDPCCDGKACYPFEFGLEAGSNYSRNAENEIATYATHPNIRYFTQDKQYGKTFEYEIARFNPHCSILLVEGIKNKDELEVIKDYKEESTIEELLAVLRASDANTRIKKALETADWSLENKKRALFSARYLNSIGKGENALALCNALEENLLKDNADPSKVDFVVPDYIKHTFEWLLQ